MLDLAPLVVEFQTSYNLSSFHFVFIFFTRQEFKRFLTNSTRIEYPKLQFFIFMIPLLLNLQMNKTITTTSYQNENARHQQKQSLLYSCSCSFMYIYVKCISMSCSQSQSQFTHSHSSPLKKLKILRSIQLQPSVDFH